jgi:hypothetical protein
VARDHRRRVVTPAPAIADRRFVVEVNEAKIHFTATGAGPWELFRLHQRDSGRILDVPGWVPGGTLALVACTDQADAEWLAAHLIDGGGLPRTAVRVRALPIMTVTGGPDACRHAATEYVSANSRPAARCRDCGLIEPVAARAGGAR